MKKLLIALAIINGLSGCFLFPEFRYPMKTFTITGIVKDTLGKPVPRIQLMIESVKHRTISIFSSGGSKVKFINTIFTDADGRFKYVFDDDSGKCEEANYEVYPREDLNPQKIYVRRIYSNCKNDYEATYEILLYNRF